MNEPVFCQERVMDDYRKGRITFDELEEIYRKEIKRLARFCAWYNRAWRWAKRLFHARKKKCNCWHIEKKPCGGYTAHIYLKSVPMRGELR